MKISCADALTLIQGGLMVDIGRVYELLNFVTSDNLYTHQLPRAARESKDHLRAAMPTLAAFVDRETYDKAHWKAYLDKAIAECGDEFEITPLAEFEHIDPLSEMLSMMGGRK
jgi:hypothetical protein